jgi:YaiO family outer membrane protein
LISVLSFCCFQIHAQDWKALNSDELFAKARELAFNGSREEAREVLKYALEKSPEYHDLRILLARTYAWDGKRNDARQELQIVLNKSPRNEDAISALTDVEIWDDQYEQALSIVNNGLSHYPNAEDFLYKKASILDNLKRPDEALLVLNQLLNINPSHKKATLLMESIKTGNMKYVAGVNYGLDYFSRTYDPAHYASAQLARTNNWGSSILRFNYSHRFSTNGSQVEVDLYPRIVNGVYAYLNYGISQSTLFPKHRLGAEVYTKLPRSFEASAGFRYLFFDSESKVIIYTGSVGWYFKNYWLSIRPYITPGGPGTSFSIATTLRRYFKDANNYIGITGGLGFSPDDRRIQSVSGLSADAIYVLKSQRAGIMWQKTFLTTWETNVSYSLGRQELSFDQGEYVLIHSLTLSVRKKF